MLVHEFIQGNKPAMVLIHGVLTPWQVWMPQIDAFRAQYNIYAIALNAHTEEAASEFVSVSAEAEQILHWFQEKGIGTIEVLCGMSLGGKIAHRIWKSGKLKIRNLILDGAPLAACPKFAVNVMIKNYKDIIHNAKKRDAKVIANFKKYFLPEQYLDPFLKIADRFTDTSIENMVGSVFAGGEMKGPDPSTRILFLHGTAGNEILSKKSAKQLRKCHPATEVVCFRGTAHCYQAIYRPEQWIEVVKTFLQASPAL